MTTTLTTGTTNDVVTESKDFLAHCVAATTGNPLLEQIKSRSAEAVLAVFRLVKNSLVHAIDNAAMVQTAEQSLEVLRTFSQEVGSAVVVTFMGDSVFVCGQLLRASRKVYEATLELGKLLERCDVSELSFGESITKEGLLEFAGALSTSLRDPNQRALISTLAVNGIAVRKVDPVLVRRQTDDDLPAPERILRFYANALMVLRQFYDSIAAGQAILPYRIKRLAQRLVTLAELNDPALLGMTAMASAHRDDAGRAIQAAIIAVCVARQVTLEKVVLARIAMAAMMADAGRVRLVGAKGRDRFVTLSEQLEASVPPMNGIVGIATGGINVSTAVRTVCTVEATWLERRNLLGPPYRGTMSPLLQSEILRVVRKLLDMLAPRDSGRAVTPTEALQAVLLDPSADRTVLRLLVRAVGVIPVGTVVEFETGEWAVVVGPSKNPQALQLPQVRLVTDRSGRALAKPKDVDLGAGRSLPPIRRIVELQEARFNVTRAFVA